MEIKRLVVHQPWRMLFFSNNLTKRLPLYSIWTPKRWYHWISKRKLTEYNKLVYKSQMNFSSHMSIFSPKGFLRRIKRLILKRIVIFRLLFYGSLILGVSTIVNNNQSQDSERSVSPSYFLMHTPKPGERYKLSGIIKAGSIEMKKGTLEKKFTVTDFKNDILVLYKGMLPQTFREGDMWYLGGFLADPEDPTVFICTSITANHAIAVDKYVGDAAVDRMTSINMIEPTVDFEYTKMA